MKKLLIFASLLLIVNLVSAQEDNSQRCGYIDNPEADKNIKEFSYSLAPKSTPLPSYVDNTLNKYFPPIVNQIGGSCSQAAGIGYIYNYELNYLLDRDAKKLENNCSYMQMWNYLNEGTGRGSFTPDGWDLIKDNGVAVSSDFKPSHSSPGNKTVWPNGYDTYYRGMHYRVASYAKFSPYPNGQSGEYVNVIPAMKQYLYDHNTGASVGGIIHFTAYADPLDCKKNYSGPSNTGYQSMISFFPKTGGHAMTIAGYDDAVQFDIDKNGSIEDDEKGAFIAMNSWGADWGDKGRYYIPYKLLKLKTGSEGGTGTGSKNCYIVVPKIAEPSMTFKLTMSHNSRNDIALRIGVAKRSGATEADKYFDVKVMYHAGGDHNLTGLYGASNQLIEVGVDASLLADYIGDSKNATFFLEVIGKTFGDKGTGELIDCSLLDYRKDKNNPIEYLSSITNPKVLNNLTSIASMQFGTTDIKEGKTIGMNFTFSAYRKKGILNLIAKKDVEVCAQIVNHKGEFVKNVFLGKVSRNGISKEIDLSDLKKGTYAIKLVAPNQLIFQSLNIK